MIIYTRVFMLLNLNLMASLNTRRTEPNSNCLASNEIVKEI